MEVNEDEENVEGLGKRVRKRSDDIYGRNEVEGDGEGLGSK
jgi:hypothetical protein